MRIAVITGAGRGLGRLIAQGVAGKGFAALCTDLDGDAAAATAALCGEHAWSMTHDVRDAGAHRRVAAAAAERGPLELWINNAGVLRSGAVWALEDADLELHVTVNLLGVMWGSRAAIEQMRRHRRGHIINMGSLTSLVPAPGMAAYAASKHAVLGFSTSLAGDLRRAGLPIAVSVICPDAVDTDMIRDNAAVEEAALLFAASSLLDPNQVAHRVLELVDRPRMVDVMPFHRGLMAHLFRPFPELGLRILELYSRVGERNRRRR